MKNLLERFRHWLGFDWNEKRFDDNKYWLDNIFSK